MSPNIRIPIQKTIASDGAVELDKDLVRHLCSLVVLCYRYRRHMPQLLTPGLTNLRGQFSLVSKDLESAMAGVTRLVKDKSKLLVPVEEVETRSYVPLLLGEKFKLKDVLERLLRAEERLVSMLTHTVRLAEKGDNRGVGGEIQRQIVLATERKRFLQAVISSL